MKKKNQGNASITESWYLLFHSQNEHCGFAVTCIDNSKPELFDATRRRPENTK
jgi:hypothetical protein